MARRTDSPAKPKSAPKTDEGQTDKLMPFKVIKTPKIRDNTGAYVKRGGQAMLNKATAEHYHEKGFIQVSMEGVFNDKSPKQSSDGPDPEDGSGTESDQSTGGADEGSSSEDASSDAGKSEDEDGAGTPPVSRRRRTSG